MQVHLANNSCKFCRIFANFAEFLQILQNFCRIFASTSSKQLVLSRANFDNDAQDEDEKGQKRDNHLTITPYPRYGILTSLHEREMGGGGSE